MKKRIIVFILLLVFAMSLTSCMRIEADITIKKNGKADMSLLYAIDQSMNSFGGDDTNIDFTDEAERLEAEGWDVQLYSDGSYTGYRATRTNVELSETSDILGDEGGTGTLRKEGSTYILDISGFGDDESVEDAMDSLALIKSFGGSIKIRITFPTKPIAHNATYVSEDGKTLEWDLLDTRLMGKIHAEFKMGGGFLKYAVIVSCITLAVAFIVFLMLRGNKNSKLVAVDGASALKYNEPGQVKWVHTVKVCPKCKHVSIGVGLLCSECGSKLIDTYCEKETWDKMTFEQRSELYQRTVGNLLYSTEY